ncbi:MAG: DUF3795 domain-containing protein [Pirellulales bacterium]|nr:DUF3795 domain-containing protein [Pirellulales bacterium]
MIDLHHAPVCGLYCGSCEFLGEKCSGCGYLEGKPFWTVQMPSGICPLHDCCRNQKHIEHCGLCVDFPCKNFLELRDPSMSDEVFKKSLDERKETLQRRKEVGTEAWLEEKAPPAA